MPPRRFSRHTFTRSFEDTNGFFQLSEREPFRFQSFDDNRQHIVADGDTVFNLAGRFFASFDRPSGLWWIIADFQTDPIIDPTIALEIGRTLAIPSLRVIVEEIFSEARRIEV